VHWVRHLRLSWPCVLWMLASCGGKSAPTTVGGSTLPWAGVSQPSAEVESLKKRADDELASRCPAPSNEVLATCRAITYKDLPVGAKALLRHLKCDTGPSSSYNYGTAVDLNGDGIPEYQFCCNEAPHGPCGAILMGRIGGKWTDLTDKGGMLGFEGPCNQFVALATQHRGFHDICLPIECAPSSEGGACNPAIWQFDGTRYRAIDTHRSSAK
jgi:hypothetical protein